MRLRFFYARKQNSLLKYKGKKACFGEIVPQTTAL